MADCLLKLLPKFVSAYRNAKLQAASDFVGNFIKEENQTDHKDVINAFLEYVQHEKFLLDMSKLFLTEFKFYHAQVETIMMQVYFVMFHLNSENVNDIVACSRYFTKKLLEFLLADEYHKIFARIGCKHFENQYVLENIIEPFLVKRSLIESALNNINNKYCMSTLSKKSTIPIEFKLSKMRKTPNPPVNTPMESRLFHAIDPPLTTDNPDVTIAMHIEKERAKNKEKALQLFEEASKMPKRLTEPRKPVQEVDVKISTSKVKTIPAKKDVEIKENLTTTLREASRLLKQHEQEIKTIEEIIKGGCALQNIEMLEEEHRKSQHQQELEAIQKKRLQGLITYEEAIIAKRKLVDENKRRVKEFKDTRAQLLEKLEDWKIQERDKMKGNVEKRKQSKKDQKEIERKTIEEKQNQVRLQQYETKEMLRKASEQKEKELAKRIELIQEIKMIHDIAMRLNAKREFDPTETANLGLFCEMSIVELEERLVLVKMKMKEELKAKRQRILNRKSEQQQMIESLKNFIAQNRGTSKTKSVPTPSQQLERSPDLVELEKLLQEKRNLRLKICSI